MSAKELLANPELFNTEVQRVFAQFDSENSGFISISELGIALRSIANANGFFGPCDTDIQFQYGLLVYNKARVSQTEFSEMLKLQLEIYKSE
jgi:hypothetical protein